MARELGLTESALREWVACAVWDRQLGVLVRASFQGSRRRYGSPRVWKDLVEDGIHVSRKRVVRLMQEQGLRVRVRKRFKATTMSDKDQPHDSDQGSHHAREDYEDVLAAQGITCSICRRGNCHDIAVMERFFSTVKSELGDRFDSPGEAQMQLSDYIEVFYNRPRRHSPIGQVRPAAYEKARATQAA